MGQQFIVVHPGQSQLVFAGLIHVSVVAGGSVGMGGTLTCPAVVSLSAGMQKCLAMCLVLQWAARLAHVVPAGSTRERETSEPLGGLGWDGLALLLPHSLGQSKL